MTDRTSDHVSISVGLALQLKRLLDLYAIADTYTHRPRIGGVLQGCPRGSQVTPAQLAVKVRIIRDAFDREVNLERTPVETDGCLRRFAEWAAGAACDDEYAPRMVKHIAAIAKDALAGK